MALIMFQYCPSCGTKKIQFRGNKFNCPDCGFIYYHNTATATGCIIQVEEKVLLLVRGMEPSLGKLDLPGGFVDPGEGAFEGLRREIIEELGWDFSSPAVHGGSPLSKIPVLFASFPNIYPYKNITYNTCDLFFFLDAPELTEKDLRIEAAEASAVRFIKPELLDFEQLAFESVKKAIRHILTLPSFFEHG